jgi:competence protein ComEC
MCVQNPMLLRWDTGFQLSFLALIGIVYLEPLIRPPLMRLLRFPALAGTAATTLAASAAVTPLLVYDFGQLAVYTLPANMLVLPLVPLAMALAAVTAAAGVLWPLAGQLVGQVAWIVAAVQLGIIRWFSELPFAAVSVPISGAAMFAVYAALAAGLVSYYRGNPVSKGAAK